MRLKTCGFPLFYRSLFYPRFLAQRTLVRFSLVSRRFLLQTHCARLVSWGINENEMVLSFCLQHRRNSLVSIYNNVENLRFLAGFPLLIFRFLSPFASSRCMYIQLRGASEDFCSKLTSPGL